MIGLLRLENAEAIHIRAEDYAKEGNKGAFDCAVARAVAPLNILLEYCLPFLKKGGVMIAYKGADCDEELENSQNAIKKLSSKIKSVVRFRLPDTDMGRALIIAVRVGDIPEAYPRGGNLPRKKPL
jgi:16S rRNA (guanine527-N7)-methyltransferase